MLFQVEIELSFPADLDSKVADELKHAERERAQELQRNGQWRHLWQIAGRPALISIFDVENRAALDALLAGLPLFPFMRIEVTALAGHPASIRADDR